MRGKVVLGLGVALILSVMASATVSNAFAGQTTRVSVSSAGVPADASALSGVLAANGRYLVFHSSASNLVTGVSGTHVYRHDRLTGATALVDLATTGFPSAGPSLRATLSADGRYVAFDSFATDLVVGDTNATQDVFVRDMNSTTTRLVSATATGAPANALSGLTGLSGAHGISDDGRFVVFTSAATNLAATNNGQQHVYVKDLESGAVERVSVNTAEEMANGISMTPAISGNGLFVAFQSAATNLAVATTPQVYVRDLAAGTTTLESPGAAAVGAPSSLPALSYDGRYLAFVSAAHLDPRDADNGNMDVFLRDRTLGTTVTASPSPNAASGVPTGSPSLSNDGRWVAYQSLDDMIVVPDVGNQIDVFLFDRVTGVVVIVSRNDADQQADTPSVGPSVSGDGGLVLFGSTASNLVAPPLGVGNQLFVRNLAANQAPVLAELGRDLTGIEGQPVRLTGAFSDNDASTSWTATVDYGDGSGTQTLALNADKTFLLDHLYSPGSYDLTVVVTDDGGLPGTLVVHVVVSNLAPTVTLASVMDLAFTRTLTAAGSFNDPGSGSGETYTATVSYGDGTGTHPLPLVDGAFALQHTYAAAGAYTMSVTVTDSEGGSTSATTLVRVGAFSYEWLDPVGQSFVVGRNLPVKFRVLGPDGRPFFDGSVRVDVVDASGTVMAGPYVFGDQPSRSVTWSGDSYHVNVDTKDFAPGTYWLRVRFSSSALTGEFTLGTTGTTSWSTARSRLR